MAGKVPRPDLPPLTGLVRRFVAEREWERYHTPKNLAMSIAIESAELAELFCDRRWADRAVVDSDTRKRVEEETADVLAYLLSLANRIDLDLDGEPPTPACPARPEGEPPRTCETELERPPDLRGRAIGVVVAAAELMELFQWLEPDQAVLATSDPGARSRIERAAREILERLISLTDPLGIDLNLALPAKMELNRAKYPAHDCRGRYERKS
jgi:NTP pyrophosphatase (non-canonical NTP hydrolase)